MRFKIVIMCANSVSRCIAICHPVQDIMVRRHEAKTRKNSNHCEQILNVSLFDKQLPLKGHFRILLLKLLSRKVETQRIKIMATLNKTLNMSEKKQRISVGPITAERKTQKIKKS